MMIQWIHKLLWSADRMFRQRSRRCSESIMFQCIT